MAGDVRLDLGRGAEYEAETKGLGKFHDGGKRLVPSTDLSSFETKDCDCSGPLGHCGDSGGSGRDDRHGRSGAHAQDLDADNAALGVHIEHDARLYFPCLSDRCSLRRNTHIEGIRLKIVAGRDRHA